MGGRETEWHVDCLYDVIPEDGRNSIGEDVVHVLNFRLLDGASRSGFTISYKPLGTPSILRFKPNYSPIGIATSPTQSKLWRTPSIEFDPDVLANEKEDGSSALFESLHRTQKSLKTKLAAIKSTLQSGLEKVGKVFCPKAKGGYHEVKLPFGARPHKIAPDKLLEPPAGSQDNDDGNDGLNEAASTVETSDPTSTIPSHSASTTRSLSHLETPESTTTFTSSPALPSQSQYHLHLLRIFSPVFILGFFVIWMILRCRDPRRRAEILAWKEERRNRRIYRRAARIHKWKLWLWNRQQAAITLWNSHVRYLLASKDFRTWDEKRARVDEQEDILEDVMKDDIRALRNAHRIVSDITVAEEGRSGLSYEPEGSERRRSVATLPGYESDSSQPPAYDDAGEFLGEVVSVNGFRYTASENEFRSDSSVISTSPRISRDGTNSDLDEKIEPISLGTSTPAGSGLQLRGV